MFKIGFGWSWHTVNIFSLVLFLQSSTCLWEPKNHLQTIVSILLVYFVKCEIRSLVEFEIVWVSESVQIFFSNAYCVCCFYRYVQDGSLTLLYGRLSKLTLGIQQGLPPGVATILQEEASGITSRRRGLRGILRNLALNTDKNILVTIL